MGPIIILLYFCLCLAVMWQAEPQNVNDILQSEIIMCEKNNGDVK